MEYNSQRNHLVILEYGRMIQKMVEHACTIEDRDKRTQSAKSIIKVMGNMNPHLKDVEGFNHKLWDHLFLISDFILDVDSPYPMPSNETLTRKPKVLGYPAKKIKFKHYGKNLERMTAAVSLKEDGEEKSYLIRNLGNFMKLSYTKWNGNSITDEVINNHLKELSEGRLKLNSNEKLIDTEDMFRHGMHQQTPVRVFRQPGSSKKKKKKNKNKPKNF
jgi:hypothetical protein